MLVKIARCIPSMIRCVLCLTILLFIAQPSFAAWGSVTTTTAGPVTASANGQTLSLTASGTISGVSSGCTSTGGFTGLALSVGQGRTIAQSNGISTGVAVAATTGQINTINNQGIISSSLTNSASSFAISLGSSSGTTITNDGTGGSSSNNYGQMYTSSSTGSSGGRASAINANDGGTASTVSIINENGGNSGSIYWGLIRGGAGTSAGAAINFVATNSGTSYSVTNSGYICSGVCSSVPVNSSINGASMTTGTLSVTNSAGGFMNGAVVGGAGILDLTVSGGAIGNRVTAANDSVNLGTNAASTLTASGGTISTNVRMQGQTTTGVALQGGTVTGDIYDNSGGTKGIVTASGGATSTVGTIGSGGAVGALSVTGSGSKLAVTGNTFSDSGTTVDSGATLELDGSSLTVGGAIDGASSGVGTLAVGNTSAVVTLGADIGSTQSLSAVTVSSGTLSAGAHAITTANGVTLSNSGQFSVGGGAVTGGVAAQNNSAFSMTSGTVDAVTANDSATLSITGGTVTSATLNGSGPHLISGGTVSSLSFGSSSTSSVDLSAGTVGGVAFASGSAGTVSVQGSAPVLTGDVVGSGTGAGAGNFETRLDYTPAVNLGTSTGNLAGVKVYDGTTLTTAHDIFAHTVTLGTSTQGGTLTLNTGGTLNASSIVDGLIGGGALHFNSSNNLSVSGAISGTGSVTQEGSGTTSLSGTNTYVGGTTVSAGTLNIASDSSLGDAAGGVTLNGGTLQTNTAVSSARSIALGSSNGTLDTDGNDSTFSGTVSGAGALSKVGTGTLTLSGTNSYQGGTTVSAGALSIADDSNLGDTAGGVTLNGGALQTSSAVSSARGISLGSSNGTIDTDGNTSTFSGTLTGAGGLTKAGAGTLILSGSNNYSGGTTVSAGTLQGNTASLQGDVADNAAVAFDQASDGTYSGVVSGTGALVKQNAGTLTLSGTNSYQGGTTIDGGVLSIASNANLGNISGGVTLDGGALQTTAGVTSARAVLLGASNGLIDTGGNSSTFSGTFSGSGGLVKVGSGTLTLSGTNGYVGGTTVRDGALKVSSDSNLGNSSGTLTLDGGMLQTSGALSSARNVVLGSSNGTFDVGGTTSTFSGTVSSTGGLTKTGAGALVLSGTNTYGGGTTVSAGTLSIASDSNLGNTSGGVTLNGGKLQTSGSISSARAITLGAGSQVVDTDGNNSTFSGVISGAGQLTKGGTGTLTLSGANNYGGGTWVSAGALQGNTTSLQGNITNNSSIVFDQSSAGTYSGAVSGTGSLTKQNAGTLTLTGSNNYTGGTTVSAGMLQGNASSLQGDITNNAAVIFNQVSVGTYSGVMSGSGSLLKLSTGTLTLAGANAYTGGTTIQAGTLRGDTTSVVGNVVNNSTLDFNQSTAGTFSGVISSTGTVVKDGMGTLTLSGANTYSGGTTVNAGVLEGNSTSLQGNIVNLSTVTFNQAASGTYAGNISGTGAVNFLGSHTVSLAGHNTYTGGTTLGGVLIGTTDNIQGNIANSGFVNFNQSTNGTYAGAISGSGMVGFSGTGTVTMTNASSYTGATQLSAGTVKAGVENVFQHTNSLDMTGGTTFDLNGHDQTVGNLFSTGGGNVTTTAGAASLTVGSAGTLSNFDGSIGAGVSLVKIGAATLNLIGTNAMSALTINDGAVQGDDQSINSDVVNNASLIFSQATDGTYAGVISSTGTVVKAGAAALTLTGSNSYTGGTSISAGTLKLGGSNVLAATGNMTVGSGAIWDLNNFNQTVGAHVNNGTTKLGTGTLSASSFAGSGTLSTTLASASAYGKLVTSGNANLTDTALTVGLGNSYIPAAGQSFSVVSAGSVTGQFSALNEPAAVSFTLDYSGNDVKLEVPAGSSGQIPYDHSAVGGNQSQIAGILDSLRNGATGDLASTMGVLNTLSATQLQSAFEQITPGAVYMTSQLAAASRGAQFSSLDQRFGAISNGTANLASSNNFNYYDARTHHPTEALLADAGTDLTGFARSTATIENSSRLGFFGTGTGSFGTVDAMRGVSGSVPGYSFNSAGASAGADYRVLDWLTLGLAFGDISTFSNSDLNGDTVNSQSFKYGGYGVAQKDNWVATGYVGGAHDQLQTTRNISFGAINRTATGDPDGSEFNTRWGLSYNWKTDTATIKPTLALEYDRMMIRAYDETDAGALDLNMGSQTAASLRTELGGKLTQDFKWVGKHWSPYVSAAWQHEYENQSQAINAQLSSGGSEFSTVSPDVGRDSILLGAGMIFDWNRTVSLFVNYLGNVGRADFYSANFDGGIRLKF